MALKGKTAIVTGASRGVGRAIATRFAREGAKLVLCYRNDEEAMGETARECETSGAEVIIFKCDIGDPETAEHICDAALERFSRIDILVNNAGATTENLLAVLDDNQIQLMVSTNILGLAWMTRAVQRSMLRQRSGVIINLSSALAAKPSRGNSVYAGTKGFVESFTRAMAVELGRKNIRVNAVAPGVIDTEMTAAVLSHSSETVLDHIGLGRIGVVEEVASAVAYLASDEASYISGAVLSVDGAFQGGR